MKLTVYFFLVAYVPYSVNFNVTTHYLPSHDGAFCRTLLICSLQYFLIGSVCYLQSERFFSGVIVDELLR